jgi:mono/diheme cytochrome c family protein
VFLGAFVLACLATSGEARADRMARGNILFNDACAHCHHDVAKLRASANSGSLRAKRGPASADPLRAWLTKPVAVNPKSLCNAAHLDANQRETMLAFLRQTVDPVRRARVAPVVPAKRNHGLAPAPKPVEPKLGQGDHR